MSFLKKIDEIHIDNRANLRIATDNGDFSSFINVEPVEKSLKSKFIIKKQEKSKLLIVSGKQRVYLSDNDIISSILSLDKKYIDWFLNAFIRLYNNEIKPFKFKISDLEFTGIGIDYYPDLYEITLFSDTVIDINDLVFVLNFIFSKDKQWENDVSIENFSKSTIVKYIVLIDYYSNKSKRSANFLRKIGYPTNKPIVFNKKDFFSDVSAFDISKYL